ncbi:YkvA family protein [Actinomadura macrotermitis]|uniref:DUF1232 domain-containing protein n=1 Tax=Actinomadura macrotermitis TaxID=2585200 RepID=A0A7K0C6Q6_9ACTN|nr:DUF1232 domain-containing protein [Actinomadura macrotermitis]MQY09149.1 hypothetical protein [Actinomadura macrotermitis]
MVWAGLILLAAGVVLAFAVGGDAGGVDLTLAGAVAMAAGAVLAVAGVLRLRRARRAGGGLAGRGVQSYYRTGTGKTVAMIAAVVYIVSPIDLIPDVFLPIGIVDDATAFTWLLFAVGQEYRRRRAVPAAPRD